MNTFRVQSSSLQKAVVALIFWADGFRGRDFANFGGGSTRDGSINQSRMITLSQAGGNEIGPDSCGMKRKILTSRLHNVDESIT